MTESFGLTHSFTPPKNRRLFEAVAGQLKESIFRGDLKPGDRLPSEIDLCKLFQVGRPVIREALRMLENSGFLLIRPGSRGGAFVRESNPDYLIGSFEAIIKFGKVTLPQIIEARVVIERAILSLVFERIQPKDIEGLEKSVRQAKECLTNKVPEPKNIEFHILLAKITRNSLLIMINKALFDIFQKYLAGFELSFERKKRVLESHELILRFIKARNLKKALEITESHIREFYRLI